MYVNLFKVNKPLSALRFRHVFLKEQETISLKYNHFGNIPCRREWQPTAVFLPGEFHGQKSLAGYSPWGRRESDTTERLTLSLSAGSSLLLGLFSSCREWGPLSVAVHRLLIAVASLVVEHGHWGMWASEVIARGLSSCGT